MTKAYRLAQIQKCLRSRSVTTQLDLARILKSAGIPPSQVTPPRAWRELGIVKTPEGYRERDPPQEQETSRDGLRRVLGAFVRDIQIARTLVVVKTLPGSAGTVAEILDMDADLGVVGTIAGDNTIFAATNSAAAAKRLLRKLIAIWRV